MCHFITAVLPHNDERHKVKYTALKFGLNWKPLQNPSVLRQLELGETYFFTTKGHCDCGTPLGSRSGLRRTNTADGRQEKAVKLLKQGWSQAKVNRWLESQKQSDSKRESAAAERAKSDEGDLTRWIDFLTEVITAQAAPSIGILLHWYSGGLETESITLVARQSIGLDELTPDFLREIQEDTLYFVTGCRSDVPTSITSLGYPVSA